MPAWKQPKEFMAPRRSIAAAFLALALGCAGPSEPDQRAIVMAVDSELVDCEGFVAQKCLRVSMGPGAPWTLFYDQIEGFAFEPGFEYILRVERLTLPPVQDGSRFAWRLSKVMRKVPAVGGEP